MKKKFLAAITALALAVVLMAGCAGAEGLQGLKGLTGGQGEPGPQGEVGPQGPAGPQGVRGSIGSAGPKGSSGRRGLQGEEGPQGPQGEQGSSGSPGARGPAGSDAEFPTPTIDGVISPGEWNDALWFDEMLGNTFENPSVMSTQIYLTNDAENLYIALVIPDICDMRAHPEVAEGGSDTFGLNIGVQGEERSYSRILQFNTTDRTENPDWFVLDGYFAQWGVAITEANTSEWGPDVEFLPIPAGVQSKTIFNATSRVQEISIPLSDLGVTPGTMLRIGGCIRAAEYGGYNFHALYPVGLDWGAGETYKSALVR